MQFTWPIAGQCIVISTTKPLCYNETGLLPGMGKLNDLSSYSYVYMYQSGPLILQPTWSPAKTIYMSSDALVHL